MVRSVRRLSVLATDILRGSADAFPPLSPGAPPLLSRFLLALLFLIAWVARLAAALATDHFVHPDEIIQYLEQGHRLASGYGYVPFDFVYGIRNYLIPVFISLIIRLCAAVGVGAAWQYDAAIKLVFCTLAMTLPLAMRLLTLNLAGRRAADVATLFGLFWYELIIWSAHPTPDILHVYALVGAAALLSAPRPSPARMVAAGALIGIAVIVRFQILPVAAVLMLLAVLRDPRAAIPALIGAAVCAAFMGWLDAVTIGYPFASILENIRLNTAPDLIVRMGKAPAYYLVLGLLISSGGLFMAGLGGLIRYRAALALPLLLLLLDLLLFSAIPHKERRFVLLSVPLYLIGLSCLITELLDRREQAPGVARVALAAILALTVATNLYFLLPLRRPVYQEPLIGRSPLREAFRYLAGRSGVGAVLCDTDEIYWHSGMFYTLDHDVPVYFPMTKPAFAEAKRDPLHYVTHWIGTSATPPAPGFTAIWQAGNLRIWARPLPPGAPPMQAAPGYSRQSDTRYSVPPRIPSFL